jgi:aerobic carbon-monoxide dehydrogenase small subunit
MTGKITLKINGLDYNVEAEPNETLLTVLREKLDITSPKRGCEMGECGACTVILNGKAVNSCLVLACECDGTSIVTVEGIRKNGELHPIQQAFIDKGAVQCGFCTPGMIMSAKALLDENPRPTESEVKEAISGNICRCTGYQPIVEAVLTAAENISREGK